MNKFRITSSRKKRIFGRKRGIRIPREYYRVSKILHNPSKKHNIETLKKALMKVKLPKYNWRKFNCSHCSAYVDWYLKGMGFRTSLATSRFSRHMWVIVHLGKRKNVAIESTLLTSNYYNPPGIVERPVRRNREHKFRSFFVYVMKFFYHILSFFGLAWIFAKYRFILPMPREAYFRPHRKYKSIFVASKYTRGLTWWKAPPFRYKYPFSEW